MSLFEAAVVLLPISYFTTAVIIKKLSEIKEPKMFPVTNITPRIEQSDPIKKLLTEVVTNMGKYPDRWQYEADIRSNDGKSGKAFSLKGYEYPFYGAINKQDNIWFGRKMTTDDYYICGVKIPEKDIKGLMTFVRDQYHKADKIKADKEITDLADKIAKLNAPKLPAPSVYIKREAKRSDTVDPFRKDVQRLHLRNRKKHTLYGKPIVDVTYDTKTNRFTIVNSLGRTLTDNGVNLGADMYVNMLDFWLEKESDRIFY